MLTCSVKHIDKLSSQLQGPTCISTSIKWTENTVELFVHSSRRWDSLTIWSKGSHCKPVVSRRVWDECCWVLPMPFAHSYLKVKFTSDDEFRYLPGVKDTFFLFNFDEDEQLLHTVNNTALSICERKPRNKLHESAGEMCKHSCHGDADIISVKVAWRALP